MTTRRLAAGGGLMLLAAGALLLLIPVLFGRPLPVVHVVWRTLAPTDRAALERQFQLTEARDHGGDRWSYVPLDTSPERLRALALDARVAGTDGIDRRSFRIARRGPRTERRGGLIVWRWGAPLMKLAAYGLAAAGTGLLLFLLFTRRPARRNSEPATEEPPPIDLAPTGMGWIERGVPVASAHAAGLFRVVFVALVLIYVARNPVYPELLDPYELGRAAGPYGAVTRWLAEHPQVVEWIDPALKVLGALVVAGAGTALIYPTFVVVFILWASVFTLGVSQHVVSALGMALIGLLPARWADAWSVDAWLQLTPSGRPPSKRYGFAIWVTMLVAGCAFLAAAVSKLGEGGDWILNGTVKYHFVSDLEYAWVTWGPRLTRNDLVAVPVSAAVIVLEAVIVTAAFARSAWYRAMMGGCAALLLGGFAVFQGVVWPGWWILLVAFLPWERVKGEAAGGAVPLGMPQRVAASTVLLLQLCASVARLEARPFVSAYDMYSSTYANDEEYEQATNLRYRVLAVWPDGATSDLGCTIDDRAALVLADAGKGDRDARTRMKQMLDGCLAGHRDVEYVKLDGEREVFDWDTSRFTVKRGLQPIGPVPIAWLWTTEEHVAR